MIVGLGPTIHEFIEISAPFSGFSAAIDGSRHLKIRAQGRSVSAAMKSPYTDSLETLIALITQMAIGKFTHRTVRGLSKDTSISEAEISKTLDTFKGLFRKPSKPSSDGHERYGLHLRYARDQAAGGTPGDEGSAGPLTSEDLTLLLNFVSERANQEAIRKATVSTNWTAIIAAIIAAAVALVSLLG